MINLLWSGGRDSTFRLCQILLVEKKSVQPIYIMNNERERRNHEMRAISDIKQRLLMKHPHVKETLSNTVFYPHENIQRNDVIKQKWGQLFDEHGIGSQYGGFSRYTRQFNLDGLELCLTNNEERPIVRLVKPNIFGLGHEARLSDQCNHGLEIFRCFRFPTIHLSKKDMDVLAIKHGFHDILELAWTCFHPNENEPCGECEACLSLQKYGLGGI